MSDFELFKQALKEYENDTELSKIATSECEYDTKTSDDDSCSHDNTLNENGVIICEDCGEEISKQISYEKEWRYYGQSDSKHSADPNRVQIRKSDERTIYKDVENMDFSEKNVAIANKIYMEVTKGKIKRGNSRKAVIFACMYQSFKIQGKPQTHENLIQVFGLSRKAGLQGLKEVTLNAPKTSAIHTSSITPAHLVEDIMDKFQATDKQKKEVIDIYEQIRNKSSKLNRARPQSVSAGLIYHWITIKNKDISLKEFAKKAKLSELTISKVAKLIEEVLEQNKQSHTV